MIVSDQRLDLERYCVIPRTLAFILCGDDVLFIQYASIKGKWSGMLNGLGGHIERGEDPLTSIRRELYEEAQLVVPNLALCGTIMIDSEEHTGIGMYVYVGRVPDKSGPISSTEGKLTWLPLNQIDEAPVLEDIRIILPASIKHAEKRACFSAQYHFDANGQIHISFANSLLE